MRIYSYRWREWEENHPACPRWIAEKCVTAIRRRVLRQAAQDAVTPQADRVDRRAVDNRAVYRSEMSAIHPARALVRRGKKYD